MPKHTLTLWYSLLDDQAGGCAFHLFESKELCQIDQENNIYNDDNIGIGVDCIVVESDSLMAVKNTVVTVNDEIIDLEKQIVCPYNQHVQMQVRMKKRLRAVKKLKEKTDASS